MVETVLTLLAKVKNNNKVLDTSQLQYLEKNVLTVEILSRPVNVLCFIKLEINFNAAMFANKANFNSICLQCFLTHSFP